MSDKILLSEIEDLAYFENKVKRLEERGASDEALAKPRAQRDLVKLFAFLNGVEVNV